jgi:sugar phosphate isomerase/epimerase
MKAGLEEWSMHHIIDAPWMEKFELVETFGLKGIQLKDATQLSPSLDRGEIKEAKEEAIHRQLYLEVGIPRLNVINPSAVALKVGNGDLLQGIKQLLLAAIEVSPQSIRSLIAESSDRWRGTPEEWRAYMDGARALMGVLSPILREHGAKLAIETHTDVTSIELLQMIEGIGDDVLGVCLDTGNLAVSLENPLHATRRLAPFVLCTHLKDCVVMLSRDGLTVQMRPLGTGIVPIADIVQTLKTHNSELNLSIEDHEGLYNVPIFREGWSRWMPTVNLEEVTWIIQQSQLCSERIRSGQWRTLESLEETPWPAQVEERLSTSARFLNEVLEGLK